MSTNDPSQADLFGSAGFDEGPGAPALSGIDPRPPLAIPCGYRNRSNAPCRRLGVRPVIIDGEPFHHRGRRVVHCDPACLQSWDAEPGDSERTGDRRTGGEAGLVR